MIEIDQLEIGADQVLIGADQAQAFKLGRNDGIGGLGIAEEDMVEAWAVRGFGDAEAGGRITLRV